MSREYPSQPVVGTGAVVLEGGKVLLVRRGNAPSRGSWSIPGGAVELGETLEEACKREVFEETGLIVEIISRCAVLNRITRDSWERVRFHYVLVDFACRPVGGRLRPASDISEAKWCPMEELAQHAPMTRGTVQVILDTAEDLKKRGIPF